MTKIEIISKMLDSLENAPDGVDAGCLKDAFWVACLDQETFLAVNDLCFEIGISERREKRYSSHGISEIRNKLLKQQRQTISFIEFLTPGT